MLEARPAAKPPEQRTLLGEIWARVDPRLRAQLQSGFDEHAPAIDVGERRVVLVGQRAAGKSWLLPVIARWVGLPGLDLDAVVEAQSRRAIATWLPADPAGFRAAERAAFAALPSPAVVAVGAGFLGLHGDLLTPEVAVLVPLTFETYRERLRADASRPRLRPSLPLEDELREVFQEREAVLARAPVLPLSRFLRATWRGSR